MSAKSQQNRLFAANQRAKLLRQTPMKPTGIIFEWGGVAFDLVPVAYGELLDASATIDKASTLYNRAQELKAGAEAQPGEEERMVGDFLALLAREAPQFIGLVQGHLAKSPGVVPEDHPEDREVFDEWFRAQDAIGMLRKLLPLLREVVGARPLPSAVTETAKKNLRTLDETTQNDSTS